MWRRVQPAVVAFIVIGGLFSGLACQAHMVAEAGSPAASHHASDEDSHEHGAGAPSHHGTHHGTHHEGSAPEEPCCIVQVADFETLNPIVLLPGAILTTAVSAVEEPAPRFLDPGQAVTHEPSAKFCLLRQTCVLLI